MWGLSLAYRKNADRDEDKAKAYELEQVGPQLRPLSADEGPRLGLMFLCLDTKCEVLKMFTFNLLSLSLSY